jgi:hypothetical protein
MDEKAIQALAFQFAASIPEHLGRPTTPPLKWSIEYDRLRVILADGRGPFFMPYPSVKVKQTQPIQAPKLMELSPRVLEPGIPPANLKPNGTRTHAVGKRKPAKHQAGSK